MRVELGHARQGEVIANASGVSVGDKERIGVYLAHDFPISSNSIWPKQWLAAQKLHGT